MREDRSLRKKLSKVKVTIIILTHISIPILKLS